MLPIWRTILMRNLRIVSTSGVVGRSNNFPAQTRCLTSKKDDIFKLEMPRNGDEQEGPKPPRKKTLDYKQKINLRDISGKMLGLKTRQEALQIANKNNWVLVDDDISKKVPTLRLVDPRQRLKAENDADTDVVQDEFVATDEHSNEEDSSKMAPTSARHQRPAAATKQMFFSSKLTEHDLSIKINHIKKWIARGQQTMVRVNAPHSRESDKLKAIEREFEETFNRPEFGVKINQKRVNAQELKLNIVPFDTKLAQKLLKSPQTGAFGNTSNNNNSSSRVNSTVDLDDIDPNKLLEEPPFKDSNSSK